MKRQRTDGGEDRLSALPDIVLIEILSLLPLETAVATSTLSRRWLHLYTHRSSLTFHVHDHADSPNDAATFWNKFNYVVSKLTLSRSFTLHLHRSYFLLTKAPYFSDTLFRQLCSPSMETLQLTSGCSLGDYRFVAPATCIFQMNSLKVIELGGCFAWNLPARSLVHLPKLNKLSIHVIASQFKMLGELISSIPSLEDLSFWVNNGWDHNGRYVCGSEDRVVDHITLVCPKLRRLCAHIYATMLKTDVIVDAPKLQYLEVDSYSSRFYFVQKLAVLSEANIRGWSCDDSYQRDSVFDIRKAICNVRSLVIEEFNKLGAKTFPNLIKLVFKMTSNSEKAIKRLLALLKVCPVLEVLVLNFPAHSMEKTGWLPWRFRPGSMLTNVKNLELNITDVQDDNTMVLVKHLLRHACALELLKINFVLKQSFKTADEGLWFLKELVDCQKKLLHCHIEYSSSSLNLSGNGSELLRN